MVRTMLRVALCQLNLPVGDIDGNVERVREGIGAAQAHGADLVIFPELSLSGYPPEDLLLKPSFAERCRVAVHELAAEVRDPVVVVGLPFLSGDLYNAAAVLADGTVAAVYRKRFLPNYAVFDEQRYFANGNRAVVIDLNGLRVGVTICEDLWYPGGPAQWGALDGGAELIVNLSASPYHRAKGLDRERMFATRCVDYSCFLAFCNAVGGQDELVFDGHSVIVDPTGHVLARGHQFEEDLVVADLDVTSASRQRLHDPRWRQRLTTDSERLDVVAVAQPAHEKPALARRALGLPLKPEAEVYRALVLCTSDYFRKNGFHHAVLGLSGGIGLSAVAGRCRRCPWRRGGHRGLDAVAVHGRHGIVRMPWNKPARSVSRCWRFRSMTWPPDTTPHWSNRLPGTASNVAEENLQARIRGNIVMALSNKFGWLVLTTGNKSEMSVGYATLYGDMAGGFSVLKDVLKTWVYRLARWRNRDGEVIPQRIIDKAPSAELREHQLDTDSLPPYDVLDGILEAYVEQDRAPAEIEALGYDATVIRRVVDLVDRAEYKRRQAPPGVRISTRAFGKDRRLPITNQFRPE